MSPASSPSNIVGLLAGFVVTAMAGGVLAAGLAMPAVGASGVIANNGVTFFDSLPGDLAQPPLSAASRLLAADGSLITEFYEEKRDPVPLSKIHPYMQRAIVAIEDERFYEHGGIDPTGLLRAAVVNQATGRTAQGASTLTQQYVKNVLLESAYARGDRKGMNKATEQTPERKIKEIRYAVTLEQSLDKNEILERYLNIAWFGGKLYGVEAASRYYFRTSAAKLNLPQAATLAGMVRDPAQNSPENFPEASVKRRNTVLDKMYSLKMIDVTARDKAQKSKLGTKITPTANGCANADIYAFYCEYVRRQIIDNDAFKDLGDTATKRKTALLRGGLTIQTAMEPKIMRAAWKATTKRIPADDKSKVATATVTVQPGTGNVLSIQQNRQYDPATNKNGRTATNYAVDYAWGGSNGFQTGSTFKAFTLATWLKAGKSLNATVSSATGTASYSQFKSCFSLSPNQTYTYSNSEGKSDGDMSVFEGTYKSVNGVYVSMEKQLNLCDIRDTAEDLGVHLAKPRNNECVVTKKYTTRVPGCLPSLTLGPLDISPMTMAAAYAAFAAEGKFCKPIAVIGIKDRNGKSKKVPTADCKQALDKNIANTVNYGLSHVLKPGGTAARVGGLPDGRPASGKTGTTNASRATWFVGYTPQLATAVWVGRPDLRNGVQIPLGQLTINGVRKPVFGATYAAPIWKDIMTVAVKGMEIEQFNKADRKLLKSDRKQLPNVQGRNVGEAFGILRAAGFTKVTVDSKPVKSKFPPGRVAGTTPDGGSAVGPDTEVTIFLSAGGGDDNGGDGGNGNGQGDGRGNDDNRGPGGDQGTGNADGRFELFD